MNLHNKQLSKEEQLHYLQQLRREKHHIVQYNNIKEYEQNTNQSSNLTNDRPNSYRNSDIFSKLPFDDLKYAHEHTLINVLDSDKRKEQYNSVDHLKYNRSKHITPLSKQEAMNYLNTQQYKLDEENTARAFKLAKQTQEAEYIQSKTNNFLYRLTN